MKRFFFLIIFLIAHAETASAFSKGPLPYRNQFPLALLFFAFDSDSAYLEKKNSFRSEISYSSIFERGAGDAPDYFVDMEVARTRFEIKGRIFDRLEVAGEITHIAVGPGFLDNFLRGYHRFLGVDVGSSDFPGNAYNYAFMGRGIHLDFSRSGSSLSDIAFKMKSKLFEEGYWYPTVSFKAALKLPTGRWNTFAGSGSTDTGISLLMSKKAGKAVFHFNCSAIAIFSSALKDTENDPVYYQGMGALEWLFSSNLSILFQVLSHKYPFSNTGIEGLEKFTMEELIGFKYRVNGFQLDFAFIEDTSDLNFSPDFSTLLGITWFGKDS